MLKSIVSKGAFQALISSLYLGLIFTLLTSGIVLLFSNIGKASLSKEMLFYFTLVSFVTFSFVLLMITQFEMRKIGRNFSYCIREIEVSEILISQEEFKNRLKMLNFTKIKENEYVRAPSFIEFGINKKQSRMAPEIKVCLMTVTTGEYSFVIKSISSFWRAPAPYFVLYYIHDELVRS